MSPPAPQPDAPDLGDVSLLIVNWNGGPGLLRCTKAAAATGAEVLLVDNASTDGSIDEVAARVAAVRILRQRTNVGFAAGMNLAARQAHGRWLLLLNPDTEVSAQAVGRLRDTLAGWPGAGAVGACLVDASLRPQQGFSVRRFPTLLTWAADLLLIDEVWPGNPVRRRYRADDLPLDAPAPYEVDQPAAACLMVTRDAFEALGGLDERFHPAWFEDVDFCRRLHAAGLAVLFEPRARVPHAGGVSLASLDRAAFARIWYRNLRRYARKQHGAVAAGLVWGLVAIGMLLRVVVDASRGRTRACRAWAGVLRDLVAPPPAVPSAS